MINDFCPVSSNMEKLKKARNRIENPVWGEIYNALLKCRINMVALSPEEYLIFHVNGEPDLTHDYTGLNQCWSTTLMVFQILYNQGSLINPGTYTACKDQYKWNTKH